MFAFKTAVLVPAIEADFKNERISPNAFNEMNFLMSIVIASNYNILSEAKESCRKL